MLRCKQTRGTEIDIEDTFDISGDDGLAIAEGRFDLARVVPAMARLPDEQPALIAFVVIDGQSYEKAADALDIPIGTAMSRNATVRRAINLAATADQGFWQCQLRCLGPPQMHRQARRFGDPINLGRRRQL
jgi:DNA-directed RNA polymerase specialized sigma24 family protein